MQRVKSHPDHGYPRGHLGHLNDEEEKALRDFKALVEQKGLYKPGPPPSHQDYTLLYVVALFSFCEVFWWATVAS